jgi:hypothetical protein
MKLTNEELLKIGNVVWTDEIKPLNWKTRVEDAAKTMFEIIPHMSSYPATTVEEEQHTTTTPGAPLSDDEMIAIVQEVRMRSGIAWLSDSWSAINKILAKRNVARPALAEVNGDMISAESYLASVGYADSRVHSSTDIARLMSAYANVLLGVIRGPNTKEELIAWEHTPSCDYIEWLINYRINYRIEHRILKPKEKTFREKVKAIISRNTNSFPVSVDAISDEIAALAEKHGGTK